MIRIDPFRRRLVAAAAAAPLAALPRPGPSRPAGWSIW
jgi:hypothetical protein